MACSSDSGRPEDFFFFILNSTIIALHTERVELKQLIIARIVGCC
jgi:hypothetical protein